MKSYSKFVSKLFLIIAGFSLLTLLLQLPNSLNTQAKSIDGYGSSTGSSSTKSWTHTNGQGTTASSTVTVTNTSSATQTIQFKEERYHCDSNSHDGNTGDTPSLHCYSNGSSSWNGVQTLAPGQSATKTVSQGITCGSAQVDIYYKINGGAQEGPYWGVIWAPNPCSTPTPKPTPNPTPSPTPTPNQQTFCDNLSVSPLSGTPPTTVTATLTGHTVNGGSITQYQFNFGDGTSTVAQTGNSVQHTYPNVGTYLVNGYVVDNKSQVLGGSASCQKIVQISQTPVPTPTPSGNGGTTIINNNTNSNSNSNTNNNNINITTGGTSTTLGTNTVTRTRTVPSTGAEVAVFPVLSGLFGLGWKLKRIKDFV